MGRVPAERHRTGKGEIVPRRYELEAARREFFAALWELVPEALEANNEIARLASSGDVEAWESAGVAMLQWQETYRLTDKWGFDAPLYLTKTEGYFAGFVPVSVYEGRERSRVTINFPEDSPYVMHNGMFRDSDSYAVLMAHLLYSDDDYEEWPGDADIGSFDPRAETIDQAVKRILPVLERRLRYGLQTIKEQDKIGDTVPARPLPSCQHFEWTVRYQVKGETIRQIAESEDVERKTVSRAVRNVAQLIGLTLRDPDKGGRPKKPKTRTIVYRRPKT